MKFNRHHITNKNYQSGNYLKESEEAYSNLNLPLIVLSIFAFFIVAIGLYFFMFNEKINLDKSSENIENSLQGQANDASVIDCQDDFDCFIEISRNCDQGKVVFDSTLDLFGMLITTKTFYEIKGIELNKCILYMRTEKQNISFSEMLIQQMLANNNTLNQIKLQENTANEQVKLVQGKDGTCKFSSNNDLTGLLKKGQAGNFSGGVSCTLKPTGNECTSRGDWSVTECEGDMFEAPSF